MKQKPLYFTLVLWLCLLEPLMKVLYFKATTDFDFAVVFANLLSRQTPREIFDFWILFPLAGLFLIKLRTWTYFGFMSLMLYIVYSFFTYESYTWPYNSETPFTYNYVITALAFFGFIFLLLPRSRQLFFDPRLRWWESLQRYNVELACEVKATNGEFVKCKTLNISRSGAFISDHPLVTKGDQVQLTLIFENEKLTIPAQVVSKHAIKNQEGFGVKFEYKSLRAILKIRNFIAALKSRHPNLNKIIAR
jgi:hypothetical protein